jgi:CheY-like chemotaxis protein
MDATLNILLAEDHADDVFLLQQAFKKAGVTSRLHVVGNGLEAQAYLKGDGVFADRAVYPFPDVLLLNLNMPRMNGFEVLKWVRQDAQCHRLVVHVLSASIREVDVQRAYELCANSYIVKPSRVNELVAFVTSLHQWHRFVALPRCSKDAQPVATVG